MGLDPITDYLKGLPRVVDADLITGRSTEELFRQIEERNGTSGGQWKLYQWKDGQAITVLDGGQRFAAHIIKLES